MKSPNELDRRVAPAITDAVHFDIRLKPYEHFLLDNGIPVYAIPSSNQETMMVELSFDAGNWYEGRKLEATAVNHLMKNGTENHSALELSEMVEYYGAFLDCSCHHEHGNFTIHSLTRHIGELLPLLREIITTPVFPGEELDLYRQNMKQHLAVNLLKCEFVANRKIDECLFGLSHPYGSFSSMEAYDALNREGLLEFYRSHYTFDRCRIFAAGKLPPDFAPQLNRQFGKDSWIGPSSAARPSYEVHPDLVHSFRIQNDPQGVQGAVRMGRPFPNRFHPDFPGMRVLNTIFGGYFGSRLMSNIREEKGFTYGIHSHLYNTRECSAITIQTEAGREVCESALTEIYKEMERIRQEPVEEEELHLVRNYLMGSMLGDLDGPFQLIQRWRDLILSGLDESYFNKNIETVRTITAEELLELAWKYFLPDPWYELIVI